MNDQYRANRDASIEERAAALLAADVVKTYANRKDAGGREVLSHATLHDPCSACGDLPADGRHTARPAGEDDMLHVRCTMCGLTWCAETYARQQHFLSVYEARNPLPPKKPWWRFW